MEAPPEEELSEELREGADDGGGMDYSFATMFAAQALLEEKDERSSVPALYPPVEPAQEQMLAPHASTGGKVDADPWSAVPVRGAADGPFMPVRARCPPSTLLSQTTISSAWILNLHYVVATLSI